MTGKGGTIPSVNQKKFLGKMDPLLNLRGVYIKKNFWENFGIYSKIILWKR